jgi:hypothetical protein
MTRSYGGGPEGRKDKQPDLRPDGGETGPGWERRLDSLSRYSADEDTLVEPIRVDFGKRLVAGIIDLFAAYVIGAIAALIPFLNMVLQLQIVMLVVLIGRDWIYDGRGLGKNLMGLQVVDIKTGLPCSLMQSVKRNIIMFGPPLVLYIINLVLGILISLKVPAVAGVAGFTSQTISTVGFIYVMIVIPYEAYRAYKRDDGMRLGDQIAGTAIIEAPMNFSHLFPR